MNTNLDYYARLRRAHFSALEVLSDEDWGAGWIHFGLVFGELQRRDGKEHPQPSAEFLQHLDNEPTIAEDPRARRKVREAFWKCMLPVSSGIMELPRCWAPAVVEHVKNLGFFIEEHDVVDATYGWKQMRREGAWLRVQYPRKLFLQEMMWVFVSLQMLRLHKAFSPGIFKGEMAIRGPIH